MRPGSKRRRSAPPPAVRPRAAPAPRHRVRPSATNATRGADRPGRCPAVAAHRRRRASVARRASIAASTEAPSVAEDPGRGIDQPVLDEAEVHGLRDRVEAVARELHDLAGALRGPTREGGRHAIEHEREAGMVTVAQRQPQRLEGYPRSVLRAHVGHAAAQARERQGGHLRRGAARGRLPARQHVIGHGHREVGPPVLHQLHTASRARARTAGSSSSLADFTTSTASASISPGACPRHGLRPAPAPTGARPRRRRDGGGAEAGRAAPGAAWRTAGRASTAPVAPDPSAVPPRSPQPEPSARTTASAASARPASARASAAWRAALQAT